MGRGYVPSYRNSLRCNRPAITHHFADKRTLYSEAVGTTCDAAYERGMDKARGETDLAARIAAFVNGANGTGSSTATLMVAALLEAQRNVHMRAESQTCVDMIRRFLTWALADAVANGDGGDGVSGDFAVLREMLTSVVFGLFLHLG